MSTRPVADPTAPAPPTARESRLFLPPWLREGVPAAARAQEDGQAVSASRRGVLTLGLGAVLGGIGALNAEGALAAPGNYQDNWRYCFRCRGLWFAGAAEEATNICPAGGVEHQMSSRNYVLRYGNSRPPGYVDNWRFCHKCRVLWWAGSHAPSVCPGDGLHSKLISGNYLVLRGGKDPVKKPQWQRCRKCQGLWYAGPPGGISFCPRDGDRHMAGSVNYLVSHKS
jgi:hypothetical protein